MAARTQLPGMRWFLWMRIAPLRIGILTGIYLSCVFVGWLIVANYIPALEPFAGAVLAKILVLIALILFIQTRPRGLFPQTGRAAEDK